MGDKARPGWFPTICFVATLGVAIAMGLAIVAAPWVLDDRSPQLLHLYAKDLTVRRTSSACAIGLLVTAFVFFRPAGLVSRKKPAAQENVAGA